MWIENVLILIQRLGIMFQIFEIGDFELRKESENIDDRKVIRDDIKIQWWLIGDVLILIQRTCYYVQILVQTFQIWGRWVPKSNRKRIGDVIGRELVMMSKWNSKTINTNRRCLN